jgi:hypothetical protein
VTAGVSVTRTVAVGLFALVAVGVGCSGPTVTTKASAELPRYTVHSLALVPFSSIATPQVRDAGDSIFSTPQGLHRSDLSMSAPSHLEPSLRQTMTVPAYASEKITQLFWNGLQKMRDLRVVSGAEAAKSQTVDSPQGTPESRGAAVAKRLKVDAVMIGEVSVYQERVGSRLGANPPASVGFEVKVVAPDGQVLWVGNYYERQRPMIEDMAGFVRRWGAFVTAEELARYGVDEVLKELPFGERGAQ